MKGTQAPIFKKQMDEEYAKNDTVACNQQNPGYGKPCGTNNSVPSKKLLETERDAKETYRLNIYIYIYIATPHNV